MRHVPICAFLLILMVVGCRPTSPDSPKSRFLALVRKDFKADRHEIESAFRGCFHAGQTLADYSEILATAKKVINVETGNVSYNWHLKDAREAEISSLHVYTTGDPPYVIEIYVVVPWT